MSSYTSNAKWTKSENTIDTHETEVFAKTICRMLLENWEAPNSPCENRGHCLNAWVEKVPNETKNTVSEGE